MSMYTKCAAVVALGMGAAAVGPAGPASADVIVNQPIGVAQCQPNTSQECPQHPVVNYTLPGTGGNVVANFTANANHCSDIEVRFIKDEPSTGGGYPASDWMRVGPGQTVSSYREDRPGGNHSYTLFARGVEGGCNIGHLDAWGGTMTVDFTPDPDQNGGQLIPFPFGRIGPDDLGIG